MAGNRIIVIGASAGGVETLKQIVSLLPVDIPAPILIVLHVLPSGTSLLPAILSRSGKLPAIHPEDGTKLRHGHIYVAPPDKHLLVRQGYVSVIQGPRENGHRPAVDPLFRTAARSYGAAVIGVILSGALDDGTAGLAAVKKQGGAAIVQDPADAMYPGMPQSAVENVEVDYVVPASEIAALLVRLAYEDVEPSPAVLDEAIEYETDILELDMAAIETENRPGQPSGYVCPECGGTLWEIEEDDILRFRCHVGHAFNAETLLAAQTDALEAALWVALRTLEDNVALARRMAERAASQNRHRAAKRYDQQAQKIEKQVTLIRSVLLQGLRAATAGTGMEVNRENYSATGSQSQEN